MLLASLGCRSSAVTPDVAAIYTAAAETAFAQFSAPAAAPQNMAAPAAPVATETAPAPTQASLAQIGQPVTQDGYRLTVTNIETATSYGYFSADPGKQFLSVELLIESGAPSGVNVNPFYVSIKDLNGYTYNTSVFGKDPSLASQNDLPQGEIARGWITFEVPTDAHGFVLTYEPIAFGNTVRIRVDLGR